MKKYALPILLFVGLSGTFHVATIHLTPHLVMNKLRKRTGQVNALRYGERPTDKNRAVPMPNPDFVYTSGFYDVSERPLRVTGTVPDSSYWSFSLYQRNAANFFVINDRQVRNRRFSFVIAKEGTPAAQLKDIPPEEILYSPTDQGFLLLRYLVDNTNYDYVRRVQQETTVRSL